MARERHSYIAFYPSDWVAGTARMTPMQELVYFRVCLFNWDKGEPCPATELPLMLGSVPDWRVILMDLVCGGKLVESPDGSVANTRAVTAAREAFDLWAKKSKGGKTGAEKTNARKSPDATPAKSADITPVETHAASGDVSGDGTRPGVSTHNLNHNLNHNQIALDAPPPAAPPAMTEIHSVEGKKTADAELLNLPDHLRARKPAAKKTRLETWDIAEGDPHVAYARECGMDTAMIAIECEKFENHHKAAGTLMADWDAAWKTWCRRWQTYAQRRAG